MTVTRASQTIKEEGSEVDRSKNRKWIKQQVKVIGMRESGEMN